MLPQSRSALRRTDGFASASLPSTSGSKQGYKKKQELLKITLDNVSMRNRIVNTSAYYRLKDCKQHMSNHKHLLQMHCEFPLVIEKPTDKPVSSYNPRSSTGNIGHIPEGGFGKDGTSEEPKHRKFKIAKVQPHSKLSSTGDNFFKKPDHHPEQMNEKPAANAAQTEPTKNILSQPEKVPKSVLNSVLMTRHFLHEDLILIYEDVLQHNGQMYHCSLTKPQ